MLTLRLAICVALAGWVCMPTAHAQRYAAPRSPYRSADYGYYQPEGEADLPPEAPLDGPPTDDASYEECASCDCAEEEEEEEECEPCRLFDCCCLEEKGITIAGWVAAGFTFNPDDPTDPQAGTGNLPVVFNYRANDFQLNQVYWYMERATDGECGLDIGGRVDFLYGSDYIFTEAYGLELERDFTQRWNSDHGNGIGGTGTNGLAMPQLYAEVAYGDLKIKLGHFYTIVGYEVVTAPDNFFYSHQYTHTFGEPFTHTGALATYSVSEQLTVAAGFHRGWDQWEDINDDLGFLGGIFWTSEDGNTSLGYSVTISDETNNVSLEETRSQHTVFVKRTLNDRWSMGLHSDIGHQDGTVGAVDDAEWYGLTGFLFYTINDCWSAGFRYEWFNDDDGFRVLAAPGAGHWNAYTMGLNYKPNANVVIRPELRWDWFDAHSDNTPDGPFDDGNSNSQFLMATDIIVRY